MVYDLIIIGAGASGLAAACKGIMENAKCKILVLEKEAIAGRKFRAAGNGKCNLTNSEFNGKCYHSQNQSFIDNWTNRHSYRDVIDFLNSMGICLYEKDGYYYPLSNQGKQVTNILYEKSRLAGVEYRFETRVTDIECIECLDIRREQQTTTDVSCYAVKAVQNGGETCSFLTRNLLVATGGKAAPKLGGCEDGYEFCKKLGLQRIDPYPALSPIYVEDHNLSLAKGVRLDTTVTLKGEDLDVKESGQVQFNENSISGIVIMNLSCYQNRRCDQKYQVFIDTLPTLSWNNLKEFLLSQKEHFPEEALILALDGLLPETFIRYILKRLRIEQNIPLKDVSEKQFNRLTSALKKLEFAPVYREDYDKAQVTGGGIATEEIMIDSFECKRHHNLYITGELLDVNGKCGGYNLTFAILSGIEAARSVVSNGQNQVIHN